MSREPCQEGVPYNPYTRAHGEQYFCKICPNCGGELCYYRESGHQHWRWYGRDLEGIYEINGIVYLKCRCGEYIQTRLKPMSASMPTVSAIKEGLLEEDEAIRGIGRISRHGAR